MARKPKPNRNPHSPAANAARRAAESEWQKENQSTLPPGQTRWFSAHELVTSEDSLRTPKAEEKPGIGAPSARQERDTLPNESDSPDAAAEARPTPDRPARATRRPDSRSRRDAAPRSRRQRPAH